MFAITQALKVIAKKQCASVLPWCTSEWFSCCYFALLGLGLVL